MGSREQAQLQEWTRRRLLRRGAELSALAALPAVLAACGSDDEPAPSAAGGSTSKVPSGPIAGTIVLRNYPGWIGDKEISTFEQRNAGTKVKEVSSATSGAAETAALLARSKGKFDLTLAGLVTAGQLEAANVLEPFVPEGVPNLSNVPEIMRKAFPIGVPGDLGKTGYAYRKDLISERPTTWAEFWELSDKYSGKVTIFRYDVDVMGAALLYKGYDVNATEPAEIEAARDALIELKPKLRALLDTDIAKPLVQGAAVMAMDYDYDIAAAMEKNPNIVWVSPEEGLPAYLEGWVPIAGSKNLATAYAFMDQHLEPEMYANYINTIGAAYVMPKAEPHIKKSIVDNPTLTYNPDQIESIGFERFLGPDAAVVRNKAWQEFLSA
jgi:spermidine/putrescine transport system substrate-binding protein